LAPTREKLDALISLYREREMYNRELDRVLSKISSLLREEPDYRAWLEEGGRLEKLPDWIHQVTGGRPFWGTPQKPVVQRQKPKQQTQAEGLYKALLKGFK
jgi:hypothetical protein